MSTSSKKMQKKSEVEMGKVRETRDGDRVGECAKADKDPKRYSKECGGHYNPYDAVTFLKQNNNTSIHYS